MIRIRHFACALIAFSFIASAQPPMDSVGTKEARKPFESAAKKIRVLSPESLPILPKEIAQALKLRHCQIPQDETAHNGETTNVIHGSFFAPDSSDWAVLCKENADSHILVFRQADAGSASKLAPLSVLDSLEGIGYDRIGYVRRIRVLDRKKFATYYARGKTRKIVLVHDAISDAMSDRFETVYYWENGKWAVVHFSASE